jgi:hypothetical protein
VAVADAGGRQRAGRIGRVPTATSGRPASEDRGVALPAEAELMLCCARLHLDSARRERIAFLLGEKPDWNRLVALAAEHGLLPLLYRHLEAMSAAVPREIFVQLWGHHETNARRNRALAGELSKILELLDANGIPALPYKGPALAVAAYGDLALREFGDLDILLRPQDVLPAKALLQAQGYVPEYGLRPAAEAALLRSSLIYHLVVTHPARAVMVELHWRTDADYPVEAVAGDAWWSSAENSGAREQKVRGFTAEELLLILCVHGTKHAWSRLLWLADISELIRRHPELKWEWVMTKAAQLGCRRRLAVGLLLAHRLLEAPLPEKTKNEIEATAGAGKLAREIAGRLFDSPRGAMTVFARLRFELRLQHERPGRQLAHGIKVVLAPTLVELSRWPLPRLLYFLYPLIRAARLTAKYLTPAVKRPE